jgi:copper chaperone
MIELDVKDMTCSHCVSAVTRAVKSLDPAAIVHVDLETKRVRVDGRSSVKELTKALAAVGYAAAPAGMPRSAVAGKSGCCCRDDQTGHCQN